MRKFLQHGHLQRQHENDVPVNLLSLIVDVVKRLSDIGKDFYHGDIKVKKIIESFCQPENMMLCKENEKYYIRLIDPIFSDRNILLRNS